eukprot:TRINITY_DN42877_c0_g1_i1.p1 TRINITY_DN42877_c0_g1~~TRINITY_DN42877_c0_g1_i1.p1  ORF type:complete len:787 (-),score=72.37 TRINITY_DN42877_c0_g1_i1:87-2225(-)
MIDFVNRASVPQEKCVYSSAMTRSTLPVSDADFNIPEPFADSPHESERSRSPIVFEVQSNPQASHIEHSDFPIASNNDGFLDQLSSDQHPRNSSVVACPQTEMSGRCSPSSQVSSDLNQAEQPNEMADTFEMVAPSPYSLVEEPPCSEKYESIESESLYGDLQHQLPPERSVTRNWETDSSLLEKKVAVAAEALAASRRPCPPQGSLLLGHTFKKRDIAKLEVPVRLSLDAEKPAASPGMLLRTRNPSTGSAYMSFRERFIVPRDNMLSSRTASKPGVAVSATLHPRSHRAKSRDRCHRSDVEGSNGDHLHIPKFGDPRTRFPAADENAADTLAFSHPSPEDGVCSHSTEAPVLSADDAHGERVVIQIPAANLAGWRRNIVTESAEYVMVPLANSCRTENSSDANSVHSVSIPEKQPQRYVSTSGNLATDLADESPQKVSFDQALPEEASTPIVCTQPEGLPLEIPLGSDSPSHAHIEIDKEEFEHSSNRVASASPTYRASSELSSLESSAVTPFAVRREAGVRRVSLQDFMTSTGHIKPSMLPPRDGCPVASRTRESFPSIPSEESPWTSEADASQWAMVQGVCDAAKRRALGLVEDSPRAKSKGAIKRSSPTSGIGTEVMGREASLVESDSHPLQADRSQKLSFSNRPQRSGEKRHQSRRPASRTLMDLVTPPPLVDQGTGKGIGGWEGFTVTRPTSSGRKAVVPARCGN